MRRVILLTAVLALVLAVVPAAADEAAEAESCDDAAREHLTSTGWSLEFDPPLPLPDPAAVRDATGGAFTSYRNAIFYFVTDFGEVPSAPVDFLLEWGDAASDFDLHVYDDEGWPLSASEDENLGGEPVERLTLRLDHCEQFQVVVRNYLGAPDETLSLTIDPAIDVEDDAEPADDTRAFLYLDSDRPGQTSMAWTQTDVIPHRATLSEERPTGGSPNSYTRTMVGFNDYANPFQAHYTVMDLQRDVVGDASALVWLSSRTMDQGGTAYVQLFLDGAKAGEVEIDGSEIGSSPTPFLVTFPDLNMRDVWDVTFQVSAEPVASSQGTTSDPGDAEFTVHYDSVQFPSRLVLP